MKIRSLDDFIKALDAMITQDIHRYQSALLSELLSDNIDAETAAVMVEDKREWWRAWRANLPNSLPAELVEDLPALKGLGARIAVLDNQLGTAATNGTVH